MQRVIAILIALLFGWQAEASLLLAASTDAETSLPPCCRKDGKHTCGMRKSAAKSHGAALGRVYLTPDAQTCPMFPTGKSVPVSSGSSDLTLGVVTGWKPQSTSAPYTVPQQPRASDAAFGAWRKRGPPAASHFS